MFLSRHQLAALLRALDAAQAAPEHRCAEPRDTARRERWSADGTFERVAYDRAEGRIGGADGERDGEHDEVKAPDPHGAAFLTIDTDTGLIRCEACARGRGNGGGQ
jgi:hypothetical protein